jgi:hypothetical protein
MPPDRASADPPPPARRPRAALAELAVFLTAPALLLTAVYFVWAGVLRFAALAALCAAVALATSRRVRLTPVLGQGRAPWLLAALVLALFGEQTARFANDVARGSECLTDMGRPSICAGQWLLEGRNPWAECLPNDYEPSRVHGSDDTFAWCLTEGRCIDRKAGGSYKRWKQNGTGLEFMDGYKYGPLLALAYLPATHLWRESGLSLVNLAFWLLQLALLAGLARLAFPTLRAAGLRAAFVFLLPSAIPTRLLWPPHWEFELHGRSFDLLAPSRFAFVRELTLNCANDVIPVALVLLALWLAATRRSLAAGIVLGLSLGMKHLPAMLLLPLLARLDGVRWQRLLAGAAATAFLAYLPFFLWAPEEMFANLVRFHIERPPNRSGLQRFLPEALRSVVVIGQLLVAVALLVRYGRAPASERTLAGLLRTAALLLIAFVALNKVVHGNYLLWIQPFTALALAGLPFVPAPGPQMPQPHGAAPASGYSPPP